MLAVLERDEELLPEADQRRRHWACEPVGLSLSSTVAGDGADA